MASRTNDSLPDTVSENGEGTIDAEGRSRRDILRGLAAAAAGAIAGGVLSTEKAEADHGSLNAVSNSGNPAIHGDNTASFGPGVLGTGDHTGVQGNAVSFGVAGFSPAGTGVLGETIEGIGVKAYSGAYAVPALQVAGRAEFSTAGSGTIAANQDSVSVSTPFVTALSHVTVTLTGDPGQAGSAPGFKPVVVWVDRQPSVNSFVVHLSRPVRVNTPFTFLVVEPV